MSIAASKDKTDAEVLAALDEFSPASIYDGTRAAHPDEVWNYRTGDGFEKALCAANILRARHPEWPIVVDLDGTNATLQAGTLRHVWPGAKGFFRTIDVASLGLADAPPAPA